MLTHFVNININLHVGTLNACENLNADFGYNQNADGPKTRDFAHHTLVLHVSVVKTCQSEHST